MPPDGSSRPFWRDVEEPVDGAYVLKASAPCKMWRAAHAAFKVASLGDLLTFYRRIKGKGVPIKYSLNHVVELSFYFEDPERHVIEIYWATGVPPVPDVHAEPIDLDVPEEQLRREVDRLAAHYGAQPPH